MRFASQLPVGYGIALCGCGQSNGSSVYQLILASASGLNKKLVSAERQKSLARRALLDPFGLPMPSASWPDLQARLLELEGRVYPLLPRKRCALHARRVPTTQSWRTLDPAQGWRPLVIEKRSCLLFSKLLRVHPSQAPLPTGMN